MTKRVNYLNNKDILKEIHKSKTTFCSFVNPDYHQYDLIVKDLTALTPDAIATAQTNRADRLAKLAYDEAVEDGKKVKLAEFEFDPVTVCKEDLVFRVMTWEHVPTVAADKKKEESIFSELLEEVDTEYGEIDVVAPTKYVKVNFPPFQHWRFNENEDLTCIGKSHWKGDLNTGEFNKEHGAVTRRLADMYIKLVERYATRSNWRGYCVDDQTEALTQQGWLNVDQITEQDTILSYTNGLLTWSTVKSIYRGHYDGLMHKMTSRGIDALVTPEHKFVTKNGLVKAEHIKESDKVVVMGGKEQGSTAEYYSDAFVELAGWTITEGCYEVNEKNEIKRIVVYQNPGPKADRIRNCLTAVGYTFTESLRKNNINFGICREDSRKIAGILPNKNLTMGFILSLTSDQRELLINTVIDGDGWKVNSHRRFSQKDKSRVDMFQALCTLAGHKTNIHYVENHMSFGKEVSYYQVNLFSPRGNTTNGSCIDFHGGKRNGKQQIGQGKAAHPNVPTTYYNGTVWCPETEYGCFVARRAGKVYLTGNTYNDEMRSQALLQLSQIGLQFDESKSANPFSYYTAVITNSFTRVLNIEKKNQNLRDDILEMNNLSPSSTRQNAWGGDHGDHE